ncbi:hypothetical protein FO440_05570 [Mucilaginibacter corticis]|uniref:YtxH domain-containing protein n=1 Tax=Mucilaginibacter corticis TaxID=2597670 RepID=A0A556MUS0_9SPHI|nr:YtxH domain-containing protein [Mucilaginibacter corticis]TSJ43657.1 hypothetical protein FO440_05570 [Mucilaginibacter corticis]
MKNPFVKKNNHNTLIALGVTGAAAAGAIAYLYFTENGTNTRSKLSDAVSGEFDKFSKVLKDGFKDLTANIISDKTNVSKKTVRKVADHVID